MGAKMSVLGRLISFLPYLRSAMVRFPLYNNLSFILWFPSVGPRGCPATEEVEVGTFQWTVPPGAGLAL